MNNTIAPETLDVGMKIKLTKDHNGVCLKRPIYGYIVAKVWCEDSPGGIFTEKGMTRGGEAYLVQTSWGGGALWYTHLALKPSKGVNRLNEWRKKLADWNERH